ncbi:MAG: HNH endonuclease signature motif containing protein [Aeromicrobium sp.]|uniref:HNH endonuclease n=1 Tax=Aeromicrobium sp. TaxID=1871063 RepID=UPI00260FB86A|nr:HNH endonuclease signature motif containing protein [Aeromicrobium sp.]MDF1705135.1 HNH endonuclease signature motif containing protein [Aeromicrobium sp.]
MFEDLAPEEVLAAVASADFGVHEPIDLMGGKHIDAIAALERLLRVTQARIVEQVDALHALRSSTGPSLEGDPSLTVAAETALARGMSPTAGRTMLATAVHLRSMPALRSAFGSGHVSEGTVRAVVRVVRDLDVDTSTAVDAVLEGRLDGVSPRRAAELARTAVVEHDVEAAAQREKTARAQQYVTYWDEPDGVGTLIVHGPAEQLVGIQQSLQVHADRLRARGDERDRGQIMVNTLFERATGIETLAGPEIELSVLMPVEALQGQPVAAELAGHGPISPQLGAELVDGAHQSWYRRLFTDAAGSLAGLDRTRRCFTGTLASWIRTRDHHRCRQPSCDCRIREIDHIRPHRSGGPTTEGNAQGLCRLSNLVKELPGWHVARDPSGSIRWTTPTGHTYDAPPPRPHRRT